ncbi:MAG: hypothetical protein H7326_00235 [Bdellovibrionaceae bacterium]|nr:hypothetical protein [Pseudobdellovibrionaceae bacterium]
MRLVLKESRQCSLNLKDTPLVPNTAGQSVQQLNTYNPADQPIGKILAVGDSLKGFKVQDIFLVPVAAIDSGLMITELQVVLKKNSNFGGESFRRVFPLYARVQNGKLTECWQRLSKGSIEANSICQSVSDGALNMASTGSTCTLANGKWFSGSPYSASCPAGTIMPINANDQSNCGIEFLPGFVDPYLSTDVMMSDGTNFPHGRAAYRLALDLGAKTCRCALATDLTAEQVNLVRCKILCLVP